MLLIDGVKYQEWEVSSEDELEQMVREHAQEIFGEQSMYIDRKQKLKSLSGIGSIPDGYVITLGNSPQWHIVEVELSSHPLHDHIVSQVGRFISGISNQNTQRGIVNAIDEEIARDDFIKLRLRKAIEPAEIYRFLTDLISKPPILTIIIEKGTEELKEALNTLRYPQIKVVEFQTFTREGVGLAVHAHLFEPIFQAPREIIPTIIQRKHEIIPVPKGGRRGPRVTIENLVKAGILKVDQVIYKRYKGQKYESKITPDGKIRLTLDGIEYDSLSTAADRIAGSVDGWEWWHTIRENGRECVLDELRKEYRATH